MKKKINGVIYLRMEVVCYVHIYIIKEMYAEKVKMTSILKQGGRE
jgi:hypothetical protein